MTSQEALTLVTEIKKFNPRLNDWGKDFLGNILIHRKISNKQAEALQNLYRKVSGGAFRAHL